LVKYADIDVRLRRVKNLNMAIVEITGRMLRAGRAPVGLSLEDLAGSRESRRQQGCQWRGVPICEGFTMVRR